jgi:hypothetical protein
MGSITQLAHSPSALDDGSVPLHSGTKHRSGLFSTGEYTPSHYLVEGDPWPCWDDPGQPTQPRNARHRPMPALPRMGSRAPGIWAKAHGVQSPANRVNDPRRPSIALSG